MSIEADREAGDFPFKKGDTVLVRVRERGNSGKIVAKFTGECAAINGNYGGVGGESAMIRLPWGLNNKVWLRPYEAEFEVVEGDDG